MRLKKIKKIELHNYVDYTLALLLMASPVLFNLKPNTIESKIMFTVGLAILLVNSITSHRLGLAKIISKKVHLKIDLFLGWLLAVSPLLFGFFGSVVLPHFLFGCVLLLNSTFFKLSSKKVKYYNVRSKVNS